MVEPLRAADFAACARIMAASDPWITLGVTEGSALERFMTGRYGGVVARSGAGAEVLGFIRFHPTGFIDRFGYVQLVAVSQAARGQGVGEAMMHHVEQECFAVSNHVFLFCSSFNHGARSFYERLGYTPVGTVPGLLVPPHGETLMVKKRPEPRGMQP